MVAGHFPPPEITPDNARAPLLNAPLIRQSTENMIRKLLNGLAATLYLRHAKLLSRGAQLAQINQRLIIIIKLNDH